MGPDDAGKPGGQSAAARAQGLVVSLSAHRVEDGLFGQLAVRTEDLLLDRAQQAGQQHRDHQHAQADQRLQLVPLSSDTETDERATDRGQDPGPGADGRRDPRTSWTSLVAEAAGLLRTVLIVTRLMPRVTHRTATTCGTEYLRHARRRPAHVRSQRQFPHLHAVRSVCVASYLRLK